jgi:hypothetical protein
MTVATVPVDLLDRVRRRVAAGGGGPTAARVAEALREEGGLRGDAELLTVLRLLQSEIAGAGPLEPLLSDPEVTDVLVNGPDEVWVDRGRGLERTRIRFPDDAAVRRLAQRLAAPSGRRLDNAQPWVDARLAHGVRLHAVLAPIAAPGTCLSLRVPRRRAFTLSELVDAERCRPTAPTCCAGWSLPGWPSSSPAAPARARRPCWRRCCRWSTATTGCCSSRTPASCRPSTRTSSAWRPARRTSRAPAR